MRYRCRRVKEKAFHRYGGSGIRICAFLHESTANLIKCVGRRKPGTKIDRINNNGHYSCGLCRECQVKKWPKNIRWATRLQQARNRGNTVSVLVNGSVKFTADLAKSAGVSENCIRERMAKFRTSKNLKALLAPSPPKRKFKVEGELLTRQQIAKRYNLNHQTVKSRISKGLSGTDLVLPAKGTGRHGSPRSN